MAYHRMSQIVNSRSDCSVCGFDVRTSQDIRQNEPYTAHCIAAVSLWTPEQWALRIRWSTGLLSHVKIVLEHSHNPRGQRQATSLEELRLPDLESLLTQIDIAKHQARELASPKTRTVGKHEHCEEGDGCSVAS